ncbi:MAG: hypothetical protein R3304_09540 [Longimicrobiales bacterium]|nr:hypothetical protein [Longimicrobiales bacterium]
MRSYIRTLMTMALTAVALAACEDNGMEPPDVLDPSDAPRATIDRFSDEAGTLFLRSATPELPAAGEPIDFDQAPFITQGLGPDGQTVRYYNFDVQPTGPAPIWVLFREGSSTPVEGQLNIIDVIPGDPGYNDFWQVVRVTVPSDYVANTATSVDDLIQADYPMETTDMVVNCPVVPEGSIAREGGGAEGLVQGWYRDQAVFYFDFNEAPIATDADGQVPTSPIFVSFNIDPGQDGGGPASGFMHQGDSDQSHNVVATLPGDAGYSPLWGVHPYSNQDFDSVHDLESAQAVDNFGHVANVNCPVVFVGEAPGDPDAAPETTIDRFSDEAGTLFVRSANAELPGAGVPIDFDTGPFITQGLGPDGQVVRYYNFDVQPTAPAPIFVLFYGNGDPVPGQLNIVDVVPGDAGYNDFWQVVKVTVPDGYIANSATSSQDLVDAGYAMEFTDMVVNCPIVPDGSTADLRLADGDVGLVQGWYEGEAIYYFHFGEAPLTLAGDGTIPTSPIFVAFNVNPDEPGGGPASGFMAEPDSDQTHNVLATLPGDAGYSPLWGVHPYDNQFFDQVTDLESAQSVENFGHAADVNCPVVFIQ